MIRESFPYDVELVGGILAFFFFISEWTTLSDGDLLAVLILVDFVGGHKSLEPSSNCLFIWGYFWLIISYKGRSFLK